ncbi:MAG: PAS domain-containing protein [Chloroflexia bacterium]|nr:PAS domain-containing protein [Chloroflexia bacterium]
MLLTIITITVGVVGYRGVTNITNAQKEIEHVRLPSVESLYMIDLAYNSVCDAERGLINRRMMDTEIRDANYKSIEKAYNLADEGIETYNSLPKNDSEVKKWDTFIEEWNLWKEKNQKVISLSKEKDKYVAQGFELNSDKIAELDSVTLQFSFAAREVGTVLSRHITEMVDESMKIAEEHGIEADNHAESSALMLLIAIIIAVILAGLLGILIANNIQGVIKKIVIQTGEISNEVTKGNFSKRADVEATNIEFRGIVSGINEILATLVNFIDSIPTPSMVIDNDFNIKYLNNAGLALSGNRHLNVIDTKCYDYFKTGHCNTENCACSKAMRNGTKSSAETYSNVGSSKLEIAYTGVPVKDKTGKIIGAFEIVTDQTAIKNEFNKSLKISQFQTEQTNKLIENLSKFAKGDLDLNLRADFADEDTKLAKQSFDQIYSALEELVQVNKMIIDKAKSIAEGDLTISLIKRSENDELISALDSMVKANSNIIGEFKTAIENIVSASQAMQAVSIELSEGASEQAASSEEVSSSMEEMVANINQNAENARSTEDIANRAALDITEGNKAVSITVDAMKKIAEKISIIGEIAERTDLLAINAAIEAARAGEQGKGFAVVAAEVRKLAENSQNAAKEIDELSKSSVHIAEESGKLLQKIVPDIQKTAVLVKDITAASLEQNAGSGQINNAITQLNTVTQRTSVASEEMAANAEELTSQAEQLSETIAFFKTDTDKIGASRRDKRSIVLAKRNEGSATSGSEKLVVKKKTNKIIELSDDEERSNFEKY